MIYGRQCTGIGICSMFIVLCIETDHKLEEEFNHNRRNFLFLMSPVTKQITNSCSRKLR